MADITHVLPQPTVVAMGEASYLLLPLTLADIARLQGFVANQVACPLDEARSQLDDASTPQAQRRKLLREVWRATKHWPPRYGSEAADGVFRSAIGRVFFVGLVLESSGVVLTVEQLAELVTQIQPGQLAELVRVAFAAQPMDELNRRLASELGEEIDQAEDDDEDEEQGDLNWPEAFVQIAYDTGWTFEQIGQLRLPAWRSLRTRGKSRLRPLNDSHEALVRRAQFFDGELDDEEAVTAPCMTGVQDGHGD